MRKWVRVLEFEWDEGNVEKSVSRHEVTPKEAEEVFLDEESGVIPDIKHSLEEERFIALGRTFERKNLFVVFTIRNHKARIISARKMHRKEVEKYEKAKRNTHI